MNNRLMREGLSKFIESLELGEQGINSDARRKIVDNLEKLWSEVLLSGYAQDPVSALSTRQPALTRDPVFINNIPFVSICQDHLLPFSGFISIGYLPDKEIVGLSNFGKLVHILAARLQLQESLTSEIADVLYKAINPTALGVYVTAQHFCMKARFPAQNITEVVTTSFRGDYNYNGFKDNFLNISACGMKIVSSEQVTEVRGKKQE
ncbi:MAG: GTP cyclohydrolase I [Nitrospirae bacterium]|nr:GTP cyclohydrolase I [Nitrospirota bacterium]